MNTAASTAATRRWNRRSPTAATGPTRMTPTMNARSTPSGRIWSSACAAAWRTVTARWSPTRPTRTRARRSKGSDLPSRESFGPPRGDDVVETLVERRILRPPSEVPSEPGVRGHEGYAKQLGRVPTQREAREPRRHLPRSGCAQPIRQPAKELGQRDGRSEEHTSELQSHVNLVC